MDLFRRASGYFVLLGLGLLFGCARSGRAAAGDGSPPAFDSLTYDQGGCFGTCPVFTLRIYADGRATYDGKQYTRFRGEHTGQFGGDTLTAIRERAARVLAAADTLPRSVFSGVVDASERTVTLYDEGESYEFTGNVSFAEPVSALLTALEPVVDAEDWTIAPGTPAPPPSELVVTLTADGQLDELLGEFYRQQLSVLDTLSGSPPRYRLRFDPYTMTGEEMVRDLGSHPDVLEVALETDEGEGN